MNEKKAKELLENQKEQLKKNLKKYKEAEENIDENEIDSDILGPRDELEYKRMLKDIEESSKDEK